MFRIYVCLFKDNWEDEDEEQKLEEQKVVLPTKTKKKLVDIIAEKEVSCLIYYFEVVLSNTFSNSLY